MTPTNAEGPDAVAAWLQAAGLADYVPLFLSEGFTSPVDVAAVTDAMLQAMGMTKVGERVKVLRLIAQHAPPSDGGLGAAAVDRALGDARRREAGAAAALAAALAAADALAAAANETEAAARAHFALLHAAVDAREQQLLGELRRADSAARSAAEGRVDALRRRLAAERRVLEQLDEAAACDSVERRSEALRGAAALELEAPPEGLPPLALPRFAAVGADAAEAAVACSGSISGLTDPSSPACTEPCEQRLSGGAPEGPLVRVGSPRGGSIVIDKVKLTALSIDGYFSAKHVALFDREGSEIPGATWQYCEEGAPGGAEFEPARSRAIEYAYQSGTKIANGNPGFETADHVYDFQEMIRQDKKGGDDGKKTYRLVRRSAVLRASSAAFGCSVEAAHASPGQRECWVCKVCHEPVRRLPGPPGGKGQGWMCGLVELWLYEDEIGTRHRIEDEVLRLKLSAMCREGMESKLETDDYTYDFDRMVRVEKGGTRKKVRLYRQPQCGKGKWGCGAKDPAYACATMDECLAAWTQRWEGIPPPMAQTRIGSKPLWSLAYCDECFAKATQTWSALSTRAGEWLQYQLPRARPCKGVEYLATAPCQKWKLGGNIPHKLRVEAFNGSRLVFQRDIEPQGPTLRVDFT